jgi:hypothetical protein
MSPACPKFFFETRKIRAPLLEKAIELSHMSKTNIMLMMALLEAELRLRPQGLSIGFASKMDISEHQTGTGVRVHLISSPHKDEQASCVAFLNRPKKRPKTVSVNVPKRHFLKERDARLIRLWDKMEQRFMYMDDEKLKRKVLLSIFWKMRRPTIGRMLKLNNIRMIIRGKKIVEVVNALITGYL